MPRQQTEIETQPCGCEEQRREDDRRQILDDVVAFHLPVPAASENHAGDEGAKHGLDTQPLRDHAESEHGTDHHGQRTLNVGAVSTDVSKGGIHGPLPNGERTDQEGSEASDGQHRAGDTGFAGGQTGDDTEDDPTHEVIGHANGDGDLSDVSPHQVQVTKNLGHNGQRRDGDADTDEEREDQARSFVSVERVRDL